MDFNWGSNNQPTAFDEQAVIQYKTSSPSNFATPSGSFKTMIFPATSYSTNPSPLPSQVNASTGVVTSDRAGLKVTLTYFIFHVVNNTNQYSATVELVSVDSSSSVTTVHYTESVTNVPAGVKSIFGITGTPPVFTLNTNDTLFFRFRDDGGSNFTEQVYDTSLSGVWYNIQGDAIAQEGLLNKHRGKLKQWDFFKDILTMFNLVTIQDKTNPKNLLIDTYDNTFLNNPNSTTYDWTQKVDATTIQIEPLKLKRNIKLKYKTDDKDYCAKVLKMFVLNMNTEV